MKRKLSVIFAMSIMAISATASDFTVEPMRLSNHEYDRLFTADRNFSAIDMNYDGYITPSDIDLIAWGKFKIMANDAMSACGESLSYDQFLSYFPTPRLDSDSLVLQNVEYKRVGDTRLMMDIYMPTVECDGEIPILLFYHGGSWCYCDKYMILEDKFMSVRDKLRSQGVAVASVNYRAANDKGQYVRDCVIDAKDALAFINREADKYGFDRDNISVFGESAGGHMTLMVGLSDPKDLPGDEGLAPYRIQPRSMVVWYGPCKITIPKFEDIDELEEGRRRSIGKYTNSTHPDVVQGCAAEISPLSYVDSADPALLVMCGDNDGPDKAYMIHEAMESVGAESEIVIVKNGGHGWWGSNLDPDIEGICEITASYVVRKSR